MRAACVILSSVIIEVGAKTVQFHSRKLNGGLDNAQTASSLALAGLAGGAFSVGIIIVLIAVCLMHQRGRRMILDTSKEISMDFVPRDGGPKNCHIAEGRVSLMRSTLSHDSSLRPIENLELEHVILGASLGRGAFGKVYKGEYAGIPLAVKVFEHDGTILCQGNEPMETYLSRNTDHPNVVKTYVNETRKTAALYYSQATSRMPSVHPSQQSLASEAKNSSMEASDDEFSYIARAMEPAEGTDSYVTWIVMEYCDMGSLHSAIKNRVFFHSAESIKPMLLSILLTARDIAQAMDYLHKQHIVHGDLKTQNVLLKQSPADMRGFTCKVGDFGLSRTIINKTHIDTFTHGTVSHSAPELFRQGLLTPAADVYSYGMLLWELITGEKAYQGTQHNGIIIAVTRGFRPAIPSHCPSDLAALISDCWSDVYTDRPSFETVLLRLNSMVERRSTSAYGECIWNSELRKMTSDVRRDGTGDSVINKNATISQVQPPIRSQVNTSNSDLKESRIEAVKVSYTTDLTDSSLDEDEDSESEGCLMEDSSFPLV